MRWRTALHRARVAALYVANLPGPLVAVLRSRIRDDGNAELALRFLLGVQSADAPGEATSSGPARSEEVVQAGAPPAVGCVRLFGWEHSYFSGKVRGYLRYKARVSGPNFDEVVATPDIISHILMPATHSNTVPQLMLPDGSFVQDSSTIIDTIEALYPSVLVLPSLEHSPQQRLACQIIELLGDEWLLVTAFHWRWAYAGDGSAAQLMPAFMQGADPLPNHRVHNVLQWGTFLRPQGSRDEQMAAGGFLIDNFFLSPLGIKSFMIDLGVTEETVVAWEASCRNVLAIFEEHLAVHPFVLGGRPSTADYGLLGPLYAHLYRDPVPGQMMRADFPRVADWCERTHRGEVVDGDWLQLDVVPETILPLLQVFFDEFWPVLRSTCGVVTRYLREERAADNQAPLPGKSFGPSSFDQHRGGPLTHCFSLPFDEVGRPGGRSTGRRLVIPYQIWMLQRIEEMSLRNGDAVPRLMPLLSRLRDGVDLLHLPDLLDGCRVRKEGGRIYPNVSARRDPPRSRL